MLVILIVVVVTYNSPLCTNIIVVDLVSTTSTNLVSIINLLLHLLCSTIPISIIVIAIVISNLVILLFISLIHFLYEVFDSEHIVFPTLDPRVIMTAPCYLVLHTQR